MDIDPVLLGVNQSNLQKISSTQFFGDNQNVDFWRAAQDLIHPEIEIRQSGFDQLMSIGATSHSPLLAYLLISRLSEPDLSLRSKIIDELSSLLDLPYNGNQTINEVLYFLKTNLSQLQRNQIVSLLDMVAADPKTYPHVMKIISQCSYAGEHLADVLAGWQSDISIRQAAARLIGDIGYLSTLPMLERLKNRFEARQSSAALIGERHKCDTMLLPYIQEALEKLNS